MVPEGLTWPLSYREMEDYQAALKLAEELLEARKRNLGEEHPDTLSTKHHLAIYYGKVGEYQTALKLAEEVLEVRKTVLGEEHPDTLSTNRLIEILKKY